MSVSRFSCNRKILSFLRFRIWKLEFWIFLRSFLGLNIRSTSFRGGLNFFLLILKLFYVNLT